MELFHLAFRALILILLNLNLAAFANDSNQNPYETNIKVRLTTNSYNPYLLSNKDILRIDFCDIKDKPYCPYLKRDMKMGNKKITKGITIEPKIEGEWRFRDSNSGIQFTPKDPWRAEETYKITIDKSILPYFITLDDNIISFETNALLSNISEMVYVQDPNDLDKKFVQTKVKFNYPIDPESFNDKYLFTSSTTANNFTTQVSYNEDKTEINLVTKIKELKENEQVLQLTLAEGIKPSFGGRALSYAKINEAKNNRKYNNSLRFSIEERVLIPSIYSYFEISKTDLQIIKNNQYIPEQIIIVGTNIPVTSAELNDHLELLLLPQDKSASFIGSSDRKNYDWQSVEEVTADIETQSEKIPFKIIPSGLDYSSINSFKVDVAEGRNILLKFKKGIKSHGGFILGKDYKKVLKAPEFPQEIKIMSEGSILSLSGEKKLSIYSLGIDELNVEVKEASQLFRMDREEYL